MEPDRERLEAGSRDRAERDSIAGRAYAAAVERGLDPAGAERDALAELVAFGDYWRSCAERAVLALQRVLEATRGAGWAGDIWWSGEAWPAGVASAVADRLDDLARTCVAQARTIHELHQERDASRANVTEARQELADAQATIRTLRRMDAEPERQAPTRDEVERCFVHDDACSMNPCHCHTRGVIDGLVERGWLTVRDDPPGTDPAEADPGEGAEFRRDVVRAEVGKVWLSDREYEDAEPDLLFEHLDAERSERARDAAERYCDRCDHDAHRCRGCGAPVGHGRAACDSCLACADPDLGGYGSGGPVGFRGEPADPEFPRLSGRQLAVLRAASPRHSDELGGGVGVFDRRELFGLGLLDGWSSEARPTSVGYLVLHRADQEQEQEQERVMAEMDLELLEGLTVWTGTVSMQMRDGQVALHVRDDAPRSSEDGRPVLMPVEDAVRVRDLLNVATARGRLPDRSGS